MIGRFQGRRGRYGMMGWVLLVIVAWVISACAPAATSPTPTPKPTEPPTPEPTPTSVQVAPPPGYDPAACFQPAVDNDRMVKFPPKPPPYKIAVSNSYIGNAWRTQMIQIAKAYVKQPHVAPLIKEFTVVSSGQDVAAQIAQMDNMIAAGVDAIILNAATPTGFDAVIRRARDAGIIVVSFDNIVTSPDAVLVNEDQVEFGRVMARDLVERLNGKGNVVMVNGVPGTSVDRDRNAGAKEVFSQYPDIKIIAEVVGMWDDGVTQKVMADLLATRGDEIDGVWVQAGTVGAVKAFIDAGRPFVPIAGEAENGFRKLMAKYRDQGLVGISVGQSPALVAVSIQAALELLQGKELPRVISVPLPVARSEDLKPGVNYFPDLPDDFFTPIKFPSCGVNLTPEEILAESAK